MVIKTIIMALVVLAVCATASATTVTSDLRVNTTTDADATLMSYSYLKEPMLNANGYTEGLKTGAFNYLVNGYFEFNDYYEYYDGLEDPAHRPAVQNDLNETVLHELDVTFDGDKGISEFYGKGFFPNHRAISAWKKIRYDDFGAYVPGETYMASTFTAGGSVWMGPEDEAPFTVNGDYDFPWTADVTEGVVEIWEATGWTNRTGAQRIDWEQTALIKGSVYIENDLYTDDGLFIPEAGANDWLSCCIGDPAIIEDVDWPSADTMKIFDCTCYPTETEAEF